MYLPAITIGYAIPSEDFDASIHSVFHSAMNLHPSEGYGLLTLALASEPDLPQGIRLDSPEHFSFEEFRIGEPAICTNGILHFENPHLTVQLSGARRWESNLSELEVDTTSPAVSSAWSLAWESLNKRQNQFHAEIVGDNLFHPDRTAQSDISRKVGKAMRELINATRRSDSTDISTVQTLIGLGSGLTPSGDDLVVGYIAGLWCTVQGRNNRARFIAELGKRIIQLSGRTNEISRTYLFHAAQGQVSSRLAALAETIHRGDEPDRIAEFVESAMQTGHTSGMDAVTGLLIGMTVWNTPESMNVIPHSSFW